MQTRVFLMDDVTRLRLDLGPLYEKWKNTSWPHKPTTNAFSTTCYFFSHCF